MIAIAVTPGISAAEYAQRRSKLASKLPQNGIAVLAAADVKYRSGAVFYDFHQETNFFYLTGMDDGRCPKPTILKIGQASMSQTPSR